MFVDGRIFRLLNCEWVGRIIDNSLDWHLPKRAIAVQYSRIKNKFRLSE